MLYNKNVIDVINYLVIMLFKVTPVSIPNTKVKLLEADGTAWETVWESKWLPGLHGSLAQLVRATGS